MGEWYWDELPKRVPWWTIAWLDPNDEPWAELMGEVETADPPKEPDFQAFHEGAKAAPHRAPPRDRSLPIGTSPPTRAVGSIPQI